MYVPFAFGLMCFRIRFWAVGFLPSDVPFPSWVLLLSYQRVPGLFGAYQKSQRSRAVANLYLSLRFARLDSLIHYFFGVSKHAERLITLFYYGYSNATLRREQ